MNMKSFFLELITAIFMVSPVEGKRGGFLFIFTEDGGFGVWTVIGIGVLECWTDSLLLLSEKYWGQ